MDGARSPPPPEVKKGRRLAVHWFLPGLLPPNRELNLHFRRGEPLLFISMVDSRLSLFLQYIEHGGRRQIALYRHFTSYE